MIQILYEDNHLLAVVKPPGIPSQEDNSGTADMLTLLKEDLKQRYAKPGNVYLGLIHRLDQPVGGAMLFAKTSKAASRLSEAVRTRAFGKTYLAVACSAPTTPYGKLVHHLRKDSRTNTVQAFSEPGPGTKEAVLEYQVAASANGLSLIAIRLHTGRPHQIRVQLSAIGCPLAGDRKYGAPGSNYGIALWSTSIAVAHPVSGEPLLFHSSPPATAAPWSNWSSGDIAAASQLAIESR